MPSQGLPTCADRRGDWESSDGRDSALSSWWAQVPTTHRPSQRCTLLTQGPSAFAVAEDFRNPWKPVCAVHAGHTCNLRQADRKFKVSLSDLAT